MSNLPMGSENDPNAPWNQNEFDNKCMYCGEPCDGYYCCDSCEKADFND